MGKNFSDQDLDNLISTVQVSLDKAEALAKNANGGKPLAKADDDKDKDKDKNASAAPADDAGAPAGAAGAAPQPPADADAGNAPAAAAAAAGADPAAGGDPAAAQPGADPNAAAGQPGDQQLAQDAGQPGQQGAEQPLSDEELNQIYGSMPPDELERHYMVIRQHLQDAYAKAEAGSIGAKPEGEKATNPNPTPGSAGSDKMDKSEVDAKFAALEKKFEDQMTKVVQALEIGFTPQRKSIANQFEVVRKSEIENGEAKPLSKEDKIAELKKIGPAALSKSERDDMNAYILRGECEEVVDKIISRGKK